ncbi:MAG: SDR family NAD(P)-dependent oxidoreductase, partial [SAR324 cluster bacterium]|nr:SDR family NAD(P)-dependent oxidoreductase [SAR324 cluster bacterium]
MKRFLNKKTLVTGGASGIGKAICQRLVEEGADLVFIDRNIEAGKAFEQELSNQESSILFVAADLTNEDEVERGFLETKKILGHIDVLINNAGGAFGENYKETTVE